MQDKQRKKEQSQRADPGGSGPEGEGGLNEGKVALDATLKSGLAGFGFSEAGL